MAARNIPIRGLEPPNFHLYPASERKAYWQRVGEIAMQVKRREVLRGIGADGRPLIKVRPSSRPDGAKGPALVPHYAASRTLRLLAIRATEKGVTLFWHSGHGKRQKLPWATILGFHADGLVIGAYVRNTIGISPAGMKKIEREAKQWWENRRKNRRMVDLLVHGIGAESAAMPKSILPAYREFDPKDPDAMRAWTGKAFGRWGKELTKPEREEIDRYAGGGHERLNAYLRKSRYVNPGDARTLKRRAARLDSAIGKGKIPENVILWRGVDPKRAGIDPAKLDGGAVLTDAGFVSTSLSRDSAEAAVFGKGAALFRLKVPKGSHAASTQEAVSRSGENELILPRNGQIRVTRVTRTATGHLIDAEWIPPTSQAPASTVAARPARPVAAPKPVPVAARPKPAPKPVKLPPAPQVVYLAPGRAPKPKSKKIQVYFE